MSYSQKPERAYLAFSIIAIDILMYHIQNEYVKTYIMVVISLVICYEVLSLVVSLETTSKVKKMVAQSEPLLVV